jgi:hypothetical protein
MKKIKCDICDKLITANNYKKHVSSCGNKKQKSKIDDNWKIDDINYKCPFCDKTFTKLGISTHIWRIHTEEGRKFNPNNKFSTNGRIIWNKGLTKETDYRVKQFGDTLSNRIKKGEIIPSFKNKTHSKETKRIISEKLSKNNNGGKCKWFLYIKNDGSKVNLQGTWEVRFAKVLDVIDENWIKIGVGYKGHSFIWKDKDKNEHFYTPDFYSPKLNKYFEVKGYWWGEDKLKMKTVIKQNPEIKIEIIRKNELINYEKLIY